MDNYREMDLPKLVLYIETTRVCLYKLTGELDESTVGSLKEIEEEPDGILSRMVNATEKYISQLTVTISKDKIVEKYKKALSEMLEVLDEKVQNSLPKN
jgi:hypothetical protein